MQDDITFKEMLLDYLEKRIKDCENIAEELIQECDNPEEADRYFARIDEIKIIIEIIKENDPPRT